MTPAAIPSPFPSASRQPFQTRRLERLLLAVLITVSVILVPMLWTGKWLAGGMLLATDALLALALLQTRRGRSEAAASLMLVTLTVSLSALIMNGQGLRDEALLALPGILIFASMFGSRRLYFAMLGLMLALMLGIGLATLLGWRSNVATLVRADTLLAVLGILSVVGYYIWLMATDLRRTMASLETEIDRVRSSHDRIELLAHHDALTGLPNRVLARDRFEQAASHAQRAGCTAALLFIDLDNFKTVNDSLGHAAGDALLRDVATRLVAAVRAGDTVSRQGGDEFLIVIGDLANGEAVAAMAAKLIDQLAAPFRLGDVELGATCSIGIALYPQNGADFDSLLKHADMAMYQAKESGRNGFRFFDEEMNVSVVHHLHLISAMRLALARGEFHLHYQPQFDLRSGQVVGAEALLRWRHAAFGALSPAEFIPLAERSGLIVELGAWVLHEACRQARQWDRAGLGPLVLAVNVSPIQFRRGDLEQSVRSALDQSGVAPARIELELTESLLLGDAPELLAQVRRLRGLGLRLAIDDFGTGYSNLGYLKRFEVERLKIDRSFVRRMSSSRNDAGIVRAIVQMAHSLEMEAVAEGVEDARTLQQLIDIGCNFGQGFHWSAALPPDAFLAFVQARQPGSEMLSGA